MSKKILFFIDNNLIHFGIAKYLQNIIDCDLFSIYDTHGKKPQTFFKTQELVKFKKSWFLETPDFSKDVDFDYLINFERRLHIDIWKMIFYERKFYKYNKFHKFSYFEILSIIEKECKFFEKILDELKPNFLCIKLTDWHDGHLLSEICKSKGIKVLMLTSTKFRNRWAILDDLDKFEFENIDKKNFENRNFKELECYLDDFNTADHVKYSVKEFQPHTFERIFKWFLYSSTRSGSLTNYWKYRGETKLKLILSGLSYFYKRKKNERFLEKISVKQIDKKTKFIYFPLHFQPERTLLISAPYYNNQLEIIIHLAKSIPIDCMLFVKEHPHMITHGWRESSYYKKIIELPNVELIHPNVSNYEMIKQSSLVISIFGTTALEASFFQKPSILFVKTSYSYLSSIHVLSSIHELSDVIKKMLTKNVNESELNDYVNKINASTFVVDLTSLKAAFNDWFYFGGVLTDVWINPKKMKIFLEQFESDFLIVAKEYAKKINP